MQAIYFLTFVLMSGIVHSCPSDKGSTTGCLAWPRFMQGNMDTVSGRIGVNGILKVKYNVDGSFKKHKARW